uniref:Ig-like domain-containing protein n=1 Tax=Fundulus heteroclitus TaxID=8078 RepID=A0A3Q2PDN8_FUNHE
MTLDYWLSGSCVNIAADLIHVFGYEGRDVKIYCSYSLGYESSEKYFCKNSCHNSDILVSTWQKNKNKYFIHDDKTKKVFTVTISYLRFNDVGKYWCGVSRWQKDIYTEVKLEVMPGKQSWCFLKFCSSPLAAQRGNYTIFIFLLLPYKQSLCDLSCKHVKRNGDSSVFNGLLLLKWRLRVIIF